MTKRAIVAGGLLIVWLIILAFVVKISLDQLAAPPWGNPVGGTVSVAIAGESQVGQQFTAPWPGLHRIDVVLEPAEAGTTQSITFHLQKEPGDDQDIWHETFNTSEIQERRSQEFEFPALRDSKGQSYFFYFEPTEATPEEAMAIGYSESAVLEGARAYSDGQSIPGNLQFHTYYTLRTRDKADLLLSQITEGRPYLLGSKIFYVGLAVVYAIVLGIFLWQVVKILLEEKKGKP